MSSLIGHIRTLMFRIWSSLFQQRASRDHAHRTIQPRESLKSVQGVNLVSKREVLKGN
jgi:hypothetical protein